MWNIVRILKCVFSVLIYYFKSNVCFKWNMDNFEFSFLSRGQLESLSLDKFFLTNKKKIW